jgi:hypothetical protein
LSSWETSPRSCLAGAGSAGGVSTLGSVIGAESVVGLGASVLESVVGAGSVVGSADGSVVGAESVVGLGASVLGGRGVADPSAGCWDSSGGGGAIAWVVGGGGGGGGASVVGKAGSPGSAETGGVTASAGVAAGAGTLTPSLGTIAVPAGAGAAVGASGEDGRPVAWGNGASFGTGAGAWTVTTPGGGPTRTVGWPGAATMIGPPGTAGPSVVGCDPSGSPPASSGVSPRCTCSQVPTWSAGVLAPAAVHTWRSELDRLYTDGVSNATTSVRASTPTTSIARESRCWRVRRRTLTRVVTTSGCSELIDFVRVCGAVSTRGGSW